MLTANDAMVATQLYDALNKIDTKLKYQQKRQTINVRMSVFDHQDSPGGRTVTLEIDPGAADHQMIIQIMLGYLLRERTRIADLLKNLGFTVPDMPAVTFHQVRS